MPRSILLGRPWPIAGEPLFLPEDTDLQLALREEEAAEAAARCPRCQLPKAVCRAKANQVRFKAEVEQCHATWAIVRAQDDMAERDIPEATRQAAVWTASLPPD